MRTGFAFSRRGAPPLALPLRAASAHPPSGAADAAALRGLAESLTRRWQRRGLRRDPSADAATLYLATDRGPGAEANRVGVADTGSDWAKVPKEPFGTPRTGCCEGSFGGLGCLGRGVARAPSRTLVTSISPGAVMYLDNCTKARARPHFCEDIEIFKNGALNWSAPQGLRYVHVLQ